MQLTNNLGLPDALCAALTYDDYTPGKSDFSVTELIKPPRIVQLTKRYREHLVTDVSESIFALFGKSIHVILERAAGEQYIIEKRFYLEHDDAIVSGQIDIYNKPEDILQDWKITSYHSVADGPKPEWIQQANLNRLILRHNKVGQISKIQYIAIFRDWSKMMAARKPNDYPQSQVRILNLPIWPEEQTREFLSERIRIHREALAGPLPLCTPEERWERPHRFALMKKGRKRAIKLYEEKEQALAAVKDGSEFVEERPGENVRCLFYCQCAPYCDFGRELIRAQSEG
jgi:hypothetical protein